MTRTTKDEYELLGGVYPGEYPEGGRGVVFSRTTWALIWSALIIGACLGLWWVG